MLELKIEMKLNYVVSKCCTVSLSPLNADVWEQHRILG